MRAAPVSSNGSFFRGEKEVRTRFFGPGVNILFSVLLVLMVCFQVQAQSGRRAPKPWSPPTVTPPARESEQPPSPKPATKQLTVLAGMEASMDIPFYMSDAVWNGF